MSDLNKVQLIGRLTKDPDLRFTQGGQPVTSFSIANSKNWKNQQGEKQEQTSFINCVSWGQLGEKVISQYAKKGQQVCVAGRLQQRTWTDQAGQKRQSVEIIVEEFQLLAKPNSNGNTQENTASTAISEKFSDPVTDDTLFSDDDIPF